MRSPARSSRCISVSCKVQPGSVCCCPLLLHADLRTTNAVDTHCFINHATELLRVIGSTPSLQQQSKVICDYTFARADLHTRLKISVLPRTPPAPHGPLLCCACSEKMDIIVGQRPKQNESQQQRGIQDLSKEHSGPAERIQ